MTYKKIYMTFNIKRHMHARVIFRCLNVSPPAFRYWKVKQITMLVHVRIHIKNVHIWNVMKKKIKDTVMIKSWNRKPGRSSVLHISH